MKNLNKIRNILKDSNLKVELNQNNRKSWIGIKKEKNSDFTMDNEKIGEMAENYRKIEIQFFEELSNYHKNIENMFSVCTNNYIDIKNKTDKKNQII